MLSLKTNGLDKHAKGMSLHLGYFDTASQVIVCLIPLSLPLERYGIIFHLLEHGKQAVGTVG